MKLQLISTLLLLVSFQAWATNGMPNIDAETTSLESNYCRSKVYNKKAAKRLAGNALLSVVALPAMWFIAPVTAGYTIYDAGVTADQREETSKILCGDYIDKSESITTNPTTEEEIAGKICRILAVTYYSDMSDRVEYQNDKQEDAEEIVISLDTKAFSIYSRSTHDEMLETEQILQNYGLPACPETVAEDLWSKTPTLRELIEFYTADVITNQIDIESEK
ncbi:MAG: hypothetical protein HN353_02875 [Bdellovibrionales bacterium]|nr:hypothetical protein [Bdellovibrionales bacterium]MBT3527151.1 hypothetical protein [Bdellovibrionales bacterium]MBT7670381.1 hypothetical protein [Bdellovibrionales bacterium]MBT7765541.1 hypothetical protein [Bdellovibrionales bacterium]